MANDNSADYESEFSGGPGMVTPKKVRRTRGTSALDDLRSIYASDPTRADAPDPDRVGDPDSYTNFRN